MDRHFHRLVPVGKATGKYTYIQMPVESYYIYSLCQASDGMLYIGTNNAGLLVYDTTKTHSDIIIETTAP